MQENIVYFCKREQGMVEVIIYVRLFSSGAAAPKGFDSHITLIPPTLDNHV
jgi:hypothetical protein